MAREGLYLEAEGLPGARNVAAVDLMISCKKCERKRRASMLNAGVKIARARGGGRRQHYIVLDCILSRLGLIYLLRVDAGAVDPLRTLLPVAPKSPSCQPTPPSEMDAAPATAAPKGTAKTGVAPARSSYSRCGEVERRKSIGMGGGRSSGAATASDGSRLDRRTCPEGHIRYYGERGLVIRRETRIVFLDHGLLGTLVLTSCIQCGLEEQFFTEEAQLACRVPSLNKVFPLYVGSGVDRCIGLAVGWGGGQIRIPILTPRPIDHVERKSSLGIDPATEQGPGELWYQATTGVTIVFISAVVDGCHTRSFIPTLNS
uniref:Uncharacterized protein n=1 Tax=Oryza brachyantha TaxID=4533 RepID=J3KUW1_ORYBR